MTTKATSENGWLVVFESANLYPFKLYDVTWRFHDVDVAVIFQDFLEQYNHLVEPVNPPTERVRDDWSWAVRPVRGQSTGYSNHASGTAIDVNATFHPRGRLASSTFTRNQITVIHRILGLYVHKGASIIRWGGDYKHSEPDAMHFEIAPGVTKAEVHQVRLDTDARRKKESAK